MRSAILLLCSFAAVFGLLVSPPQAFSQTKLQFEKMRDRMVEDEIVGAGVKNKRVIEAIRMTPRHEFVSLNLRKHAYLDMALPIGNQQTISPPFIVAYMTEQLDPKKTDKVLEIGTGSGYQAAVLSPIVRKVYSIEIVEPLGRKAKRVLKRLGYKNVYTRIGDGYLGWPEAAPFDKIIVTCSPENVPKALVKQLREGGRMIVPVGERYAQNLYLFTKKDGKLVKEALRATLFVPMTGKAEKRRKVLPDPLNPNVLNGDFEELLEKSEQPANWHYLRQYKIVQDDRFTPKGKQHIQFKNSEAGRGCQGLQGFSVDGRKISLLNVSYYVKGKDIVYGQKRSQWPYIVITFYNERRAQIRTETIGPFTGTFDWRKESSKIEVPLAAREGIFRIGLLGATGEISLDAIKMQAIKPEK